MPIVDLNEVLQPAQRNCYAVGAFNLVDLSTLYSVLEAAESLHSPVILNVAEVHLKYCSLEDLALIARRRAAMSPVPVVLHLDHGTSFAMVEKAIENGFSSVMIDASSKELAENIDLTKAVVSKAHALGVTVEAELGQVCGGEGNIYGSEADRSRFTVPGEAAEFVALTGVDALAVAIGSVHGQYRGEPRLELELLAEIARLVPVPLVLHGGSGIPDGLIVQAIERGIAKINVFTEMGLAALMRIKTAIAPDPIPLSYPQLLRESQAAMTSLVKRKITLFGSVGQAKAGSYA